MNYWSFAEAEIGGAILLGLVTLCLLWCWVVPGTNKRIDDK